MAPLPPSRENRLVEQAGRCALRYTRQRHTLGHEGVTRPRHPLREPRLLQPRDKPQGASRKGVGGIPRERARRRVVRLPEGP